MKKMFVVFALLAMSVYQSEALTIETDKVAHLGAGYMTADLVGSLKITGDKTYDQIVIPMASVALVATAKEALDARPGGTGYDWKDWGYTMFGGLLKIFVKVTIQFN